MKRHVVAVALATGLVALSVHTAHSWSWNTPPAIRSAPITRGPVVRTVEAEGTLKARETILVGSQVSGTIAELDADFNSVVHRGQVLARLDPSIVRAEIQESRAALAQAQADAEQARVARDDAKYQFDQARALRTKDEIPQSDFETAEAAFKLADAQVEAMEAQVRQARSRVAQSEVDLKNTIVLSPADGVVVARDVQVGQTVASRLQAPTLFEIATDLSKLQVIAGVDESDIGVVAVGQPVRFTVGAYPGEQFGGTVKQVRLNPDTSEDTVEYDVVVDVDNSALKLRPGMTPTVAIEVARRDNVLQVPEAAMRFVPSPEVFRQIGDPAPANLDAISRAEKRVAETARGYVWLVDGRHLKPVPVTVGISDGVRTEVSSGALRPGMAVVTGVALKT
jgi:HlyD family secretion protein